MEEKDKERINKKFKDPMALCKAYMALEAEFTRRSQRLRALEKQLADDMNFHNATEQAYKNGYKDGYEAAMSQINEKSELERCAIKKYLDKENKND